MLKYKNYLPETEVNPNKENVTGNIIPWTVMADETEKDYKILLPNGLIIPITLENAKWLRAQLMSIR